MDRFFEEEYKNEYQVENNLIPIDIIQIKGLNEVLRETINKKIALICAGDSKLDIELIKIRIRRLFRDKNINQQMALISEFFVHLIINLKEYEQKSLFFNNEDERQLKKGFDGFYIKNNEIWIMESKSGSINTKGISHYRKVREAINDLNNKFSDNSNNNPWANAFAHAAIVGVRTKNINNDFLSKIDKLSSDYLTNKLYTIQDFNIIPAATIFLDDANNIFEELKQDKIFLDIKELINDFSLKKAHIICISQKNIALFKEYIGIKE